MIVTRCGLEGLRIIQPKIHSDPRGWFLESWNEERYREAGINGPFVQENLSFSHRGTLRGLHFQNPHAQGKLVTVLQGEVFDVAVDLRRSSPTFRSWFSIQLNSETKQQFYVPPGFAHGFLSLSEEVWFLYKCTALYSPADVVYLRWDDPDLKIEWPFAASMLSPKDAEAPRLADIAPDRLFA